MLTEEKIQQNKEEFLKLIRTISREGMNTDRLVAQLEGSDFFYAPASSMYHCAYRGGLCEHSLNVYYTLQKMAYSMYPVTGEDDGVAFHASMPFSEDSMKIVALLHDFDKMNKYERTVMNKKVYSETGSKYDEMGKYDWQSVPGYKMKDAKDRFVMGTHGENSVFMTETFIPLNVEEHCAIVNHHAVYDNPKLNTTDIFNRYPLACLLHLADMASTYILEKI